MTSLVRDEPSALFDLSDRTKLRFTGNDRVRFLNGQITNDVRKASESVALHACVLNVKGKMDAEIFVAAQPESIFVDAPAELREALAARFERYLIADDVTIEDVTAQYALFHATGRTAPELFDGGLWRAAERFGESGWDFWGEAAAHGRLIAELTERLPLCDDASTERRRIASGVPRWGHELTAEIIPNEANLEASCIDYAKGCYIGQEVISRIKMSGQTNKRLCQLIPLAEGAAAGMKLFAAAEGTRDAGWITSVATKLASGERVALGYVRRGFWETGTRLEARSPGESAAGVAVEVRALHLAEF
jgi:folate-binding protein YgfZ